MRGVPAAGPGQRAAAPASLARLKRGLRLPGTFPRQSLPQAAGPPPNAPSCCCSPPGCSGWVSPCNSTTMPATCHHMPQAMDSTLRNSRGEFPNEWGMVPGEPRGCTYVTRGAHVCGKQPPAGPAYCCNGACVVVASRVPLPCALHRARRRCPSRPSCPLPDDNPDQGLVESLRAVLRHLGGGSIILVDPEARVWTHHLPIGAPRL